jgi:hypothetical protein
MPERTHGWKVREREAGGSSSIMSNKEAPILDRLGVDRSNWVRTVQEFGRIFKQAADRSRGNWTL